MALAINALGVMERVGMGDTLRLSGWIEAQEKASRTAGFAGIARLCETVSECLAGLRRGEQPVLVPLIGTLLEVCRTVELHAETLAKTLRRAGRAVRPESGEGRSESCAGAAVPFVPLVLPSGPTVPSA
jgi:hypothetical protein